jgi:hypothetical protein
MQSTRGHVLQYCSASTLWRAGLRSHLPLLVKSERNVIEQREVIGANRRTPRKLAPTLNMPRPRERSLLHTSFSVRGEFYTCNTCSVMVSQRGCYRHQCSQLQPGQQDLGQEAHANTQLQVRIPLLVVVRF